MISVNVIIDNPKWKKKSINLNKYIKKNISILSKIPKFKNKNYNFSILFTDNKKMKTLNYKFRGKNKKTDVLSFPLNKKKKPNQNYLGDIAISYEFVYNRSKKTNLFFEIDKMWVHGYLHLLGYDHKLSSEYKLMNNREIKILKYFDHKFV